MRKIVAGLALVLALLITHFYSASPVLAADTEISGSGSYFRPEDGKSTWFVEGSIAFPVIGNLLVGPIVGLGDADDDTEPFAGGLVEFNLTGKSGPYVGGKALWRLDNDIDERRSLSALGGFKFSIGANAALRLQAEKVFDGFGEDGSLSGTVGFLVRI